MDNHQHHSGCISAYKTFNLFLLQHKITYQECQIFIEVECHLHLQTKFDIFSHGKVTKPYHETIFGTDDRVLSLGDRGQGFIWAKPYSQDA